MVLKPVALSPKDKVLPPANPATGVVTEEFAVPPPPPPLPPDVLAETPILFAEPPLVPIVAPNGIPPGPVAPVEVVADGPPAA